VRGRDPLPPVSPQRARDDDDFNAERVRPRRGPPRLNSPMPTKIFDEPRATPPSRWAGFPSLDGSFAGWASVPPRVRDALLEIGARSRRAYVRMDGEEFDILSLTSSGQPASQPVRPCISLRSTVCDDAVVSCEFEYVLLSLFHVRTF
jgi:hypothetical protein